ncbi:MAG: LiaF domain-containing protein [Longimicrobiaceae bacterium]
MSERRAARLAAVAVLGATLAACHPADAQRMRSTTSARQLQGERRVNVEVEYGAGRLRVAPTRGDLLYRMELRYDDERYRPVTEYDRAAGRLKLGVESREHRGRSRGNRDREQHATIELTRQVPIALSLAFGAGEAQVELGGLALEDVELKTGASRTVVSFAAPNRAAARRVKVEAGAAEVRVSGLGNTRAPRFEFSGGMGETTLDFGGTWTRSATAQINMGVGSVRLRIPRALGVRVTRDSFLSSFDADGLVKRGDAWFSRNYAQARHKLDISIHAAVGSVEVDWID